MCLLALGTAACTSSAGESDSEVTAESADELATTGPTYQAGTQLRTSANLNLRSAGSIKANILRVMPQGSVVTVRFASGANAWVAVKYNGYDGWAHTSYLDKVGSNDVSGYGAARGSKLASTALRVDGRSSGGWCALEMSNSVEKSGIIPNNVTWYRNNAIDISEYMAANTAYDAKVGFKRIGVSANDVPKGSIIGWRRGQCGYHSKYGHIEIAVDSSSSRACSDYCGSIKKTCGAPYVFMPTTL
jgi:uncharacterized protein YraI